MGVILTVLIIQWILLLVWIVFMKMEDEDENLPSFLQGLSMIVLPGAIIILLLIYLYKNDKLNRE